MQVHDLQFQDYAVLQQIQWELDAQKVAVQLQNVESNEIQSAIINQADFELQNIKSEFIEWSQAVTSISSDNIKTESSKNELCNPNALQSISCSIPQSNEVESALTKLNPIVETSPCQAEIIPIVQCEAELSQHLIKNDLENSQNEEVLLWAENGKHLNNFQPLEPFSKNVQTSLQIFSL